MLHGIEAALGRERTEHWGPRTIDLDLIQYGSILSYSDELLLPHPRAHERRFVIEPWHEIEPDGTLGIIDFGCVKVIPEDFYQGYFALIKKELVIKEEELNQVFYSLDFISDKDTEEEKIYFKGVFKEMISLLGKPFHVDRFDFADDSYFEQIFLLGDRISNDKMFRKSRQARGSRHGLYINRTYFGLYNLLNQLQAEVDTTKPEWLR